MKHRPCRPRSPRLSLSPCLFLCLLLLVATASAFTELNELNALFKLRNALRALEGGLVATLTWRCDDINSCDPCGDLDGNGWGTWRYLGCRTSDGAPKGRVSRVHLTGTNAFPYSSYSFFFLNISKTKTRVDL
jgi:hypothetical protein